MGRGLDFECRVCGSPAVSLPSPLTESSVVHCAVCRGEIGTWRAYKASIADALTHSEAAISADPMLFIVAPSATSSEVRVQSSSNGFSGKVWPASS
jgi:hypothetical protein